MHFLYLSHYRLIALRQFLLLVLKLLSLSVEDHSMLLWKDIPECALPIRRDRLISR